MVVLNKIYTRTGDKGTTALGNGERVAKHDARVEAYGTSDELNCFVGVARLEADMAADRDAEYPPLRVTQEQVDRLEREIDVMNSELEPLRSFILPGGRALAAHLHVCRTVARRAERLAVLLSEQTAINPACVTYLNRLSDWFFVAARMANNAGKEDVLWVPGANRA